MFCRNCGNELPDSASYCYHCGCAVNNGQSQTPQTYQQTTEQHVQQKSNSVAIIGFILAFFISIAGLICSIIGLKNAPQYGGNGKGFAIAGIILSAIRIFLVIIVVVIFVCVFGAFFGALEDYASFMIL